MKTPDEIKDGLAYCPAQYSAFCGICPYSNDGRDCGRNGRQIMLDALAYIQRLEADNSRKDDTINNLTELLNAAHEETERVMQERDAACITIKQMAEELDTPACEWCKGNLFDTFDAACKECRMHNEGFEWRGVCKENTEVQEPIKKAEDCRYYTANSFWGAGCLGTKEIDPCKGDKCNSWKPKEDRR